MIGIISVDTKEGTYTLHHIQSFFTSLNLIFDNAVLNAPFCSLLLAICHRTVPYHYRAYEEFFSDTSSSCYRVIDSFLMIMNYVHFFSIVKR